MPPCEAPIWVATKRAKKEVALLVRDDIVWMECDEARDEYGITPTEPRLGLPEAAEEFVAYAVEVSVGGERVVEQQRPGNPCTPLKWAIKAIRGTRQHRRHRAGEGDHKGRNERSRRIEAGMNGWGSGHSLRHSRIPLPQASQ